MQKLKEWFASLQPRERLAVGVAGVLVSVMVIYVLGLAPFFRAVNTLEQSVATKKSDLAWMRGNAPQVQMLAASQPQVGGTGEGLVLVVDRTAREAGLGESLTGQTPNSDNTSVRVTLQDAAFDMLIVWLTGLQSTQGVTIESASINKAAQPGLVNVTLELNRAGG